MKQLFIILVALILLSGCAPDHETEFIANGLESALLNHMDVLEVERISQVVNLVTGDYIDDEVVIFRLRYKSDQYEVIGYVAAPYDYLDHEYPILIYTRGGHLYVGMQTPETIGWIASRGYIVLGSQYRGVAGGTGMEQFGGDDINDVLRLIDISESLTFAQQGGVYMAGDSRGGMMTYIAIRKDDRIRAAAVWAAISNSFDLFNDRRDMRSVFTSLVGGTPDELPEEYERRSAVLWANELTIPILIGHGTSDWRVRYSQSTNMAEALERYGNPHKLLIYPNEGHSIIMPFLDEMDEWFRQHPIIP